jgi:predicted transposase YbfD/YdcC
MSQLRIQIAEIKRDKDIRLERIGKEKALVICRKLLRILDTVPDSRMERKTTYRLSDILLMLFLATLAGADSCLGAQDFWNAQARFARRLFRTDSIPSHDTFRRVLGLVKPEAFNSVLVKILLVSDSGVRKALGLPKTDRSLLSVDGKVMRGTGRKGGTIEEIKDLQVLNVYDQDSETCLFSEAIEDKTNEIPHAQKILAEIALGDTVVTFDAMHMQKETVRIISEGKGDYVGGLKGNQGTLNDFAGSIFTEGNLRKLEALDGCFHKTSEISHNQLEERFFYMFPVTASQKKGVLDGWKKAHAIVCYRKHTINNVTGAEGLETRYYLTSLKDIQEAAYCIRAHWGVENSLHWMLDTVFLEDEVQLSSRTAALNQSILNKACLSLYKKLSDLVDKKEKRSKKRWRKMFGWSFEDMLGQMLTLMDPLTLARTIEVTDKVKK